MRGKVISADRVQRLVIGFLLTLINLAGILNEPTIGRWVALALQLELLVTGLAGWCPFYWAMGVGVGNREPAKSGGH